MSRAKHQDNLNAVQLFPFVAVLLCTMGSLLVLLVGVARSSKVRAVEEAVAQQAAAKAAVTAQEQPTPPIDEAARRELEKIAAYQSELETARTKAEERLSQEQLRLRHLEDHMRRLREQLDSLKLAAAELNSLEGEHYDDREQAEREVTRLAQLIEESRTLIAELRAEANKKAKSYAIVPYQGHRGTRRRPVYIECREDEVVLQPEGVRLTIDDFRPPIGPGNPLVAALRAAREHIVTYESSAATGKEAEPYPLIIVRPKGVPFYYYVREAIQSWDSEFGYELVEEDWELKYSPADPQLANKEFEAAELARGRLRALAAAAPQAYGAYRFGGGGGGGDEYGYDGGDGAYDGDYHGGSDNSASPQQAGSGGGRLAARAVPSGAIVAVERGVAEPSQSSGGTSDNRYATGNATGTATDDTPNVAAKPPQKPVPTSGQAQQPPSDDESPTGVSAVAGDDPDQELDDMARAAAAKPEDAARIRSARKVRGKNWAIRNANPGMIPIRRTIQLVVRDDALAILPEAAAENNSPAAGREFRFENTPEGAYEDLVVALDARIKDWGMAGQGLYWRPVVDMKVGPDGERRVDDLVRLLRNSGIEIRNGEMAQHDTGEDGHANH